MNNPMNKKTPVTSKLTLKLNREVLKQLGAKELSLVAGGGSGAIAMGPCRKTV